MRKYFRQFWVCLGRNKGQVTTILSLVVVGVGFFEFYDGKYEKSLDRALMEISHFENSEEAETEAKVSSIVASQEYTTSRKRLKSEFDSGGIVDDAAEWSDYWIYHFYEEVFGVSGSNIIGAERSVVKLIHFFRRVSICATSQVCNPRLMCKHFAVRMDHIRCQLKILIYEWSEQWGMCLTDEIDEFLDSYCQDIMAEQHSLPGDDYVDIANNTCFQNVEYVPDLCKSYEKLSSK